MDTMIDSGRLTEFIREMLHIRNEETEEDCAWEVWLHKVFDSTSYKEYRESLNDMNSNNAAPTHEKLKQTVSDSANLLKNFCPYGGGEQGGTVQTIGDDSG